MLKGLVKWNQVMFIPRMPTNSLTGKLFQFTVLISKKIILKDAEKIFDKIKTSFLI